MKALVMGWIVLMFSTPLVVLGGGDDDLSVPDGPVILTVSGNIDHMNIGSEAQFDRAMLTALPQHEFETTTPWTDGSAYYSGPLMRDVLSLLNPACEMVHVSALNGYEAEIPVSDFNKYDVILAMAKNGEAIPIREYGPLWVLYPFDEDEVLLSEKIRFRAVWQVMHINVL